MSRSGRDDAPEPESTIRRTELDRTQPMGPETAGGKATGDSTLGILIVKEYGGDEREVRIPRGQVVIGRDPKAEVVLRDLGVSRLHARIHREEEKFYLEDLGSRNGTLLNEKEVPKKEDLLLKDGDNIQVGRSILRFLMKISRKIASSWRRNNEPVTQGIEAKDRPVCLFLLKKIKAALIVAPGGGRPPVRYPLTSDRVRIGRDPRADIILEHASVGAEHAEIVYNVDGFHLVDRDSQGGTFLDGVAAPLARLSQGSFVRFGKVEALFSVIAEGEEAPVPSFALRDHLLELYPDRAPLIQKTFRESREYGLDLGAELVLRGAFSPGEWWAASKEHRQSRGGTGKPGLWSRLFGGRGSGSRAGASR